MKDIIQIISNLEDMRFIKPAPMEQIIEAEKKLGVSFADDYTKYVEKYGVISARGIELTGVTTHERLSVVSVTKKERNMNSNIPANMYVIENIAIDGIIALQDETGKVYTITPNGTPKLSYNSLSEYVEKSNF
ncbi:SMI1/KNR4 family protein [Agathobaculum butyriciproducens]|uniref:SMI1/KNR4 family protein n=1 Tax=Agathobaculum butyriciproducens TaxID=1628085 RepID=UPI003A8FC780